MTRASEDRAHVAVVVDSAASLPAELAGLPRMHVAPMGLSIGGRTYLDGRDLAPGDFYRLLRESPTPASTSAPSPARFLEAFLEASEEARAVLCLTVASRFSASFDSATVAAQDAKETIPGLDVLVLDTQSAAGGEALIALEALRAADQGHGLDEVAARAGEAAERVTLLAFIDTLHYLWKGGRVPGIAHVGTSLLGIKPLFELKRGQVRTVARPRTRRRAMRRLIELMGERVEPGRLHATIMHADASEAAEELRRRVEAAYPCENLFLSEFTPVMGAHIGPGLLGVAFWSPPS